MKTIIAPTDFSPTSINAVNYAADLARSINASLSILHVYQIPMAFSEVPVPAEIIDELPKNAEAKISKLKEAILKRTNNTLKIFTEVRSGAVITELMDYCASLHPYAIVMGTQGAGALERFIFGSNTISAMKNLSWPLVVVPAEAAFTEIRKIGLACDLKNVSANSSINEIKKLVTEFGAQLHVLHVNKQGDHVYGPEIIEQSGVLQQLLEDQHPVYHFLNDTGIEEGLTGFAEKNKLDMLIVIPKKYGLIENLFHKSQSKKLLLHTHVPVIAVHE